MITYVKGDLFTSPSKILVNTVNTVGVMGKGIAYEFKKRYPEMFENYKYLCDEKKLDIGKLVLYRNEPNWILLFPTKKNWRNPSKIEYIEQGLKKFSECWDKLGANSISFPRLGCGNGGLDWKEVKPLMEKYLKRIPMNILIYVGDYDDPRPEHENESEIEKWLKGENGLEGYERFRMELTNYLKNNKESDLKLGDITIKENNANVYFGEELIEEEEICAFWNWVRDVGIVEEKDIPIVYKRFGKTMLELMNRLNYVKKIKVSENGFDFFNMSNAYQYNKTVEE